MRFTCLSVNRSGNDTAVWIGIYCSVLFMPLSRQRATHTSLVEGVAACVVLLAAVAVANFVCRKRCLKAQHSTSSRISKACLETRMIP